MTLYYRILLNQERIPRDVKEQKIICDYVKFSCTSYAKISNFLKSKPLTLVLAISAVVETTPQLSFSKVYLYHIVYFK